MVRKSLAETLNAQAREFLEEGRPKRTSQPIPEPPSSSPLSGLDRVLDTNWWSKDDQASIKSALLKRYTEQLARAGFRVTSSGLVDQAGKGAPSTRGVDKEVRILRREVAILADVVRALLDLSVQLGGRTPEDLRRLLCEEPKTRVKEEPAPSEEAPPPAEEPKAAAPEENGNAASASAAADAEADAEEAKAAAAPSTEDDDEESFFGSFLRPSTPARPAPANGPARPTPTKESGPRMRPLKGRGDEAPAKEKPRERVPRRDLWKERVPERTKTCPRCSREVSIRVPRCLSCGKTF